MQTVPAPADLSGTAIMESLGPPDRRAPTEADRNRPTDLQAVPRRQARPAYPQEALPTEQACVARILYHVEVDGSATLIRLEWDQPPDLPFLEVFEESIRDAMAGWEFSPAHRIIVHEDRNGVLDSEAIPIKYADRVIIRFHVVEGRGIVE